MQVKVRTTQNVFIHYPLASVGDRIAAYLIDLLVIAVFVIAMVALFISAQIQVMWLWIVMVGAPILFYHLLFEIFMNGQSPGKYAMKIKVLRVDGTPATVGNYTLRWIFAFVDIQIMSGLIAVLTIAIGGKGQRLGDIVAGTTVVKLVDKETVKASEVFVQPESQYEPTFPQVVQLNENDIELIQRALEVNRDSGNAQPVMAVTEKIKTLLGIQTDLPPVKFLYTIIKDFQHITAR
ncbi:MAG: RDD family protein [Cyclobacteriaceae bacterium]|nr:RDD family protein [Cyclobacteriaceae bacterium]